MAARSRNLRKWWLAVHLYLGLTLGLLLSVTGITGSLLVFYVELDEILNPELVLAESQSPRLPYEALFQALKQAEPQRQRGWRLEIPEQPQQMVMARYYKPVETEHMGFAPLMVAINPYTAEVVNSRFWGEFAMTWIYDLHYNLLLGASGKIVMAIVGGLLLVSLLSGLYLWWPAANKWRSALTFKAHTSIQRWVYDSHKLSGVYSLIVMLMLAITGIALEIPQYFNPLIEVFSPLQAAPKPLSQLTGSVRISLDKAVEAAQQQFPDARLCWIETPHDATGSYRINLRQAGEPSRRFPKTNIWVDQYSAQILAIQNPNQFKAGDSVLSWFHPLHSGEALAMPGRLLVLLTGLLCPMLVVTGCWRWLQKRAASKR